MARRVPELEVPPDLERSVEFEDPYLDNLAALGELASDEQGIADGLVAHGKSRALHALTPDPPTLRRHDDVVPYRRHRSV